MHSKSLDIWIGLALLALLAAAPFFIYPIFLMEVLCFALFASAFNLLIGYGGLLSFGHAMFFGLGAYVCAHMLKVGTVFIPFIGTETIGPFGPAGSILLGTLAACILAILTGALAIRRQGIYFAMVTLALSQLVYFMCWQAPFTHGEDGIQGVPRGALFGIIDLNKDINLYYVVLAVFAGGLFLIYRTIHSPFGQILKAIREDEKRAISLGYNVDRYKLTAFILSGTLAGLAGATKVLVFKLASATDIAWQMSGEVVLMTLLGGLGTVLGPSIGAAVIVGLQDNLNDMINWLVGALNALIHALGSTYTIGPQTDWTLVVQGAIFVVTVMLFRRGIAGEIGALMRRKPG